MPKISVSFRDVYDHGQMFHFDTEYDPSSGGYLIHQTDEHGRRIRDLHSYKTPSLDSLSSLQIIGLQTIRGSED